MHAEAWSWLVKTDAGLGLRIGVGCGIFALLALLDLARHGTKAQRWREYLLLLAAVGGAMAYGIVNDQLTSRISWEYFYYGKELAPVLGPRTPPDPHALHWEAAKVGMKATWSAGLIVGVLLLLANNPRRGRPRLPYRTLLAWLGRILLTAAACACVLGWAGHRGDLAWISDDFRQMVRENSLRPYRFMCVWGVHLGGYLGALLGVAWAFVAILRKRALAAL